VIRELRERADAPLRIVGMDHIGFGLSDQASFEMVDMHHSANLLELVRHLDLRRTTLVVHDWGGPIGIGALLEEPERVDALMVLNTTVFPIPSDGLTYGNFPITWMPWYRWPSLVPDRLWGAVASFVLSVEEQSTAALQLGFAAHLFRDLTGILDRRPLSAEQVWRRQLGTRMNARSSKRNARQTIVWGHGYNYHDRQEGRQDNGNYYRFIQETLPAAWGPQGRNIPARAVIGEWDALGKQSVIDQWEAALPQLRGHVEVHPDAGHFIEEQRPGEIAAAILDVSARARAGG
jgi:pimeloyl-ACP methyl ester carboxylesterase